MYQHVKEDLLLLIYSIIHRIQSAKKKTLNDKIEQKVINYVAKEVNKNSTKADVIKLASKMGYSSSDVAEVYDYIKDELNNYNSYNSSTGVSSNTNAIRRKKMKVKYKRKS